MVKYIVSYGSYHRGSTIAVLRKQDHAGVISFCFVPLHLKIKSKMAKI